MADHNQAAQETKPARPPEGPFAGVVGTIIGGVLGMLILVLVVSLLERRPQDGEYEELPHAALMVEVPGDLSSDALRKCVVGFHKQLVATGLGVQGPLDYPLLVPGDRPGAMPQAKRLDEISDAEWARAFPYLAAGGWLVPKLYSPDVKRVIFRLAPPAGVTFPPGTRDRLEQLLAEFRSAGSKAWIYSRALQLEDEESRSVINATFGVQTAHVYLRSEGGNLTKAVTLGKIHEEVAKLATNRIRSATSMGSFAVYLAAARSHEKGPDMKIVDVPGAVALARKLGMPVSVSEDGKKGVLEVMTDAEGAENLAVGYLIVGNLDPSKTDDTSGRMERKRR